MRAQAYDGDHQTLHLPRLHSALQLLLLQQVAHKPRTRLEVPHNYHRPKLYGIIGPIASFLTFFLGLAAVRQRPAA